MRLKLLLLATMTLVVVASGSLAVAAASLVNGNFETGDLTGWSVDTTASGETASAVTGYTVRDPFQYCEWDCPPNYLNVSPHEGSRFGLLKVADQSQWTTLSQPFEASNGDRISGWVFTLETLYQTRGFTTPGFEDKGQVVLTDGSGTTVATLFEDSGSSGDHNSPWRYWEYNFTDLTGEGQFQIQAKQSSQMWSMAPDGWSWEPNVLGLDDVKVSTVSVAPSPPKITSPQNNTYDTDGSFSVSGSAERGSTVELFEGTTSKGTTKADPSTGAWSIALSGVTDGAHTYTAKATNVAGTSNASSPVSIIVDTVKPSAPTIDSPADNSYDTDGNITFDGHAERGSTVKVYQDGATTSAGSYATANTAGDAWWYIYLTGVSEQSTAHTFDFTATDAAGNESAKRTVHVDVGKLEDVLLRDKTAPTVIDSSLMPPSGATGYPRDTGVLADFSEVIDPKTVITTPKDPANPNVGTSTTFKLVKYGTTTPISASVWVHEDNSNKTVSLDPSSNLAANTKYTVKITGGTNGVKDLAGNQLGGGNKASGDYWWNFTTGSLPRK